MQGNMKDARATAEAWTPEGARELEGMASAGWLTEEEELEVRLTLALIVDSVRQGSISSHFANRLIRMLAEEKAERWRERQGQAGG